MPIQQILRCVAIVVACSACSSHAQTPTSVRPAYTAERYDEDWSFLRDASKRTDLFDPIKWIPLGKDESWFVTLGGELRERVEYVRNPAVGFPCPSPGKDGIQRSFLF